MKVVDSPRRQIVMAVLLFVAALGSLVRCWAPDPSTLRDVGTLMLVLWLPAVGNLVGFVIQKFRQRAHDFAPGAAFTPHLSADVEQLVPGVPLDRCTVIVGQEGFTARLRKSPNETMEFEFLRPILALPKLPPGTDFHLLVGTVTAARGRVLALPG